jgi:PKD repeat protein
VTASGLTPSTPVSVVVDTTAPAAPVKPAVSSDNTLTWTAGKNTGTAVSYLVRFDDATPTTVTSPPVAAPSAPGPHTYTVTARDAAGNLSKPVTGSYWWDLTPPVAPQITAPSNLGVQKATSAVVSWTGGSDAESGIRGYRITVNGTVAPKVLSAATTSAKVTLRTGLNTVAVTAVNQTGASTAGTPVIVTVDTKAPAPASGLALSANGLLSWTAAPDTGTPVSFTASLDGGAGTVAGGTSLQVATPTGRHTWTVVAQDAAGNRSKPTILTVVR